MTSREGSQRSFSASNLRSLSALKKFKIRYIKYKEREVNKSANNDDDLDVDSVSITKTERTQCEHKPIAPRTQGSQIAIFENETQIRNKTIPNQDWKKDPVFLQNDFPEELQQIV